MADRVGTVESDVKAGLSKAADNLGDRAADAIDRVAGRVRNGGGSAAIADEAKSVAGDLKAAAVDQGRQFYETAKVQATGFVDQRKNEAAQSVSDLAASLRETGKTFGERPNIQAFVGSAADGLDQFATGLRDRSFVEIYSEVEAYARRSPATVGAVAVVAGFFLARFIKSSSSELSEQSAAARSGARSASARRAAAVDA